MKFRIPRNRVTVNGIGALLVALLLILISPFPARAALGDNAASVLTDQARMNGTLHSIDLRTYVMHEITAEGADFNCLPLGEERAQTLADFAWRFC
jgi:hypothetical protein